MRKSEIISDLFGSESDSQLFPNYYDLFGRNSVLDSEDGQIVFQPTLPATESTVSQNFCCEYCPKAFSRKRYLLDHLNIHTGKRPHICKFCLKNFTQRASCNRHMKLCHPELVNSNQNNSSKIIKPEN
ncbi:unnamed protein product [Larinioides sclopetarius]|uniref:C2H2-type domain-containing protein n=1 Tax=Larinioides sclopetarius TaxID=280406 RepID=A0AAV1ZFP6_9ARAC